MPEFSTSLVLVALAALSGAAIQSMSGFGFGMVCMALLPMLMPVDQAVPMVGAWGLTLNILLLWRLRAHVRGSRVLPLVGGAVLGVPLGLAFLRGADPRLVRGVLGAVVLSYALLALSGRLAVGRRALSPRWGLLAGLLGGALGGAFNTAGPPAVVYLSIKGLDKDATTSTMQAFFVFTSTCSVLGFWAVGLYTPEVVAHTLPLFPAVWLGSLLGTRIYDRVPQARFRTLVLTLLLVLGGNFLVRAAIGA